MDEAYQNLFLYFSLGILACATALLLTASLYLIRESSILSEAFETGALSHRKLALGTQAPHFSQADIRTGLVVSDKVFDNEPCILLFLSGDCMICKTIANELSHSTHSATLHLAVSWSGSRRSAYAYLGDIPENIFLLLSEKNYLEHIFKITGFPTAVFLDNEWRISNIIHPQNMVEIIHEFNRSQADPSQQTISGTLPIS